MATDTTTQAFLTADAQDDNAEVLDGGLAETASYSAPTAQIGRWFASQATFLQAGLSAAATAIGGSATPVPVINLTQEDTLGTLTSQTGYEFDVQYLPADIANHSATISTDQTYAASGSQTLVADVATQAAPVLQDQLYEAALLDQQSYFGTTSTGLFTATFTAGPPLAAIGPANAADRAFIDAAGHADLTGMMEGQLAFALQGVSNTQGYGAWEIANDGSLNADLGALAAAAGVTVPGTVDATGAVQIANLGALSGLAFDTQLASYSIGNSLAAITVFKAESAAGSDPALVALANAALPTADQLLAQAVINDGESAGGLNDSTAAPTAAAGAILTSAANAAATGSAVIADYDGSASTPGALAAGQVGIQFVNASETAPTGYGFLIDTAAVAPVTITGAANQFEAVAGSTFGLTYYGAAGGSGDIALTGGTNLVLAAPSALNYYVDADQGDSTIYAGNGNDSIVTGYSSNVIGLGSGNNVVVAGGSGADGFSSDTIVGSTGDDTIYAGGGTAQVFAGTKGVTLVETGGSASLATGAASSTIFGDDGSITTLSGGGANVIVGGFYDTINGAGLTGGGNAFFLSGNNSNEVIGGSGNTFFIIGGGYGGSTNDTIIGGAGANLYDFNVNQQGASTDQIAFNPNSVIDLTGYAANEAANAVANQKDTAGGVSFTLSDNTQITLTGVASVGAANFIS